MNNQNTSGAPALSRFMTALLLAASLLLTGCATAYVDNATREIPASQYRKVAQPKPVRMSFEFQRAGAPNPAATDALRGQVNDQVAASGLFAGFVTAPDAGVLSVTINNLPANTAEAAAKGFVTGFTLGLAGNTVTDFYECKISYLAPGQTQPVTTTSRHAIHTSLGATSGPAASKATPAKSVEDAVRTMTRQIVSNALNNLSQQAALN